MSVETLRLIDRLTLELIDEFSDRIPDRDYLEFLRSFVHEDESILAFETLDDYVQENSILISPSERQCFQRIQAMIDELVNSMKKEGRR